MTPRRELTSVGYALTSNTALNLVCTGCVSQSHLSFAPGDITAVNAGTGLTGGGTSGDVTLNVNTAAIQSRVTGSCASGSSIRVINADGTVVCEADDGITVETDPQVGSNTLNYVPRWDGSALVTGMIYDNGSNIGIGTSSPVSKLDVNGDVNINSSSVYKIGGNTVLSTKGSGNTFLGLRTLRDGDVGSNAT